MEKKIIQVDEKVPVKMLIPLSLQHMFAMFGASVLVPFLFGISPAIVLLMNGVGTLVFIVVTKGKAPAYLGSSFAFLVPAGLVIEKFGYQYALGSFVAIGFGGIIVALITLAINNWYNFLFFILFILSLYYCHTLCFHMITALPQNLKLLSFLFAFSILFLWYDINLSHFIIVCNTFLIIM